jgi:hypothetical protein
MATSDPKTLPAQARRRIEELEAQISELTGALGALASEVLHPGTALPPRLARFAVFRLGSTPGQKVGHKAGLKSAVKSGPASKKATGMVQGKAVRRVRAEKNASASAAAPSEQPEQRRGLAGALARGEAAKVRWIASGEIVPARVLADRWGLTPQALGPAAARGEVFALVVKNQRYYPREFLELDRDAVSAVTRALGDLSPSEMLVFWKRPHGALGGKTLLQALGTSDAPRGGPDGAVARATELARSWSQEAHASCDAPAAP